MDEIKIHKSKKTTNEFNKEERKLQKYKLGNFSGMDFEAILQDEARKLKEKEQKEKKEQKTEMQNLYEIQRARMATMKNLKQAEKTKEDIEQDER